MEHPVPQNVTSFEFHLVGDMTLKQFVYLASGVALAYFTFVLFMGSAPLIATPLIAIFALSGVALAFLPILDRPLDHWVGAFFRAVYAPTQAHWKSMTNPKAKVTLDDPAFKNRLGAYLATMELTDVPYLMPHPAAHTPSLNVPAAQIPPKKKPSFLEELEHSVANLLPHQTPKIVTSTQLPEPSKPQVAQNPPQLPTTSYPTQNHPTTLPSSDELDKLVDMAKQAQMLQVKITETEKQINQLKENASKNTAEPQAFHNEAKQVFENLQHFIQQAEVIHEETAKIKPAPPQNQPTPAPTPKVVRTITPTPISEPSHQMILSTFPNVINGIVTDPAGNYLEGVIVIIHNKDGIPVRALKSNKLGQFTGATSLSSDTYTLTLEKEGFRFDTLKVTLTGEAILPINISARPKEAQA